MGRYSTESSFSSIQKTQTNVPVYSSNPYASNSMQMGQQMSQEQMQKQLTIQEMQRTWPTVFSKPIIGIEREGVIIEKTDFPITSIQQMKFIPGSLEAIRTIRLKGHRLLIINSQPWISAGKLTSEQVNSTNAELMQVFGESGIFSIDGLYYSTSSMKEDMYAKPNTGMFDRARREVKVDWKTGWYVGTDIEDLKVAERIGSTPILLLTGNGKSTIKKLETFANRDLKKKTKVFNNLLEFSRDLQ